MTTILDKILNYKKEFITNSKFQTPLEILIGQTVNLPVPRNFVKALRAPGISLISEIKKASPSGGLIRPDFEKPEEIAKVYAANGARAISVLTDERFFQGSLDYLRQVHSAIELPILRKDFIIDDYQIYEGRAAGADCILLIVAILSPGQLSSLMELSSHLGMSTLVEVHSEEELGIALSCGARLIGINNRNLKTLKIELRVTLELIKLIPDDRVVVSESGISTREDVLRLEKAGVDAILVGEALMREKDIGRKVRELCGR